MELVTDITEHEMIATFLSAELRSTRFNAQIVQHLEHLQLDRSLIETPDLANKTENALRLQLLGDYRGYKQQRELFEYFPSALLWQRFELTQQELLSVQYINYSYWNELSQNTRLPGTAAEAVRQGRDVYGQSSSIFLRAADAFRAGAVFPELILVRSGVDRPLVVLEGHLRLTAFALAVDALPVKTSVIVGTSPEIENWPDYSSTAEDISG